MVHYRTVADVVHPMATYVEGFIKYEHLFVVLRKLIAFKKASIYS